MMIAVTCNERTEYELDLEQFKVQFRSQYFDGDLCQGFSSNCGIWVKETADKS